MPKRSNQDNQVYQEHLNSNDHKGLLGLPFDVVLTIFGLLDLGFVQWVCLQSVCQKWFLESRSSRWLALLRPVFSSNASVQHMSSLQGLQHLSLNVNLTAEQSKLLTRLTSLKEIIIKSWLNVEALSSLRNLESATLDMRRNNLSGLVSMCSGLSTLKFLNVSNLDDETVQGLPTSLQELHVGWHAKLTLLNVDMKQFNRIHTLHLLGRSITNASLSSLPCLNLTNLNLSHSLTITNEGLHYLSNMTSLKLLDLSGTLHIFDVTPIVRLTLLENLNLCGTRISNEGLRHLSCLKSLQKLNLSLTKITHLGCVSLLTNLVSLVCISPIIKQGTDALSGLLKLEHLDLDETNITDEGIAHISLLPSLRFLRLGVCTDRGVVPLSILTQLSSLSLASCDFLTNTSTRAIQCMTRLEALWLGNCQSISDDDLLELTVLRALSKLDVCRVVSEKVKRVFKEHHVNIGWAGELLD